MRITLNKKWGFSIIGLILLDQATKYIAYAELVSPLHIIGDFFKLSYSENTGIAFGIEIPLLILIVSNFILLTLLIYIGGKEINLKKPLGAGIGALIFAGAVGNMLDRFTRGFVIDFILIWKWPIFNFADIYITIGVLAFILFYGRIKRPKY